MLVSEKHRFIFVAVPKTATTAIETHLMHLDPELRRNEVLGCDGKWVPVHKHVPASEIRRIMSNRFSDYRTVAFIRDPLSAAVSKYFFYKSGRGARRAKKLVFSRRAFGRQLRVASAKILPLRIWVLLYPYSMTHKYLLDTDGTILIQEFGDFENLQQEFERIFCQFEYSVDELQLPVVNKGGRVSRNYGEDRFLRWLVSRKSETDTRLFRDWIARETVTDVNIRDLP